MKLLAVLSLLLVVATVAALPSYVPLSELPNEAFPDSPLIVDCRDALCSDYTFDCPPNTACEFMCTGARPCRRFIVNCPAGSQCRINCNASYSCMTTEMRCNSAYCAHECHFPGSCYANSFRCFDESQCESNCDAYKSCKSTSSIDDPSPRHDFDYHCESALESATGVASSCKEHCTDECDKSPGPLETTVEDHRIQVVFRVVGELSVLGYSVANVLVLPSSFQLLFDGPHPTYPLDEVASGDLYEALKYSEFIADGGTVKVSSVTSSTLLFEIGPAFLENELRVMAPLISEYLDGIIPSRIEFSDSFIVLEWATTRADHTIDFIEPPLLDVPVSLAMDLIERFFSDYFVAAGNVPESLFVSEVNSDQAPALYVMTLSYPVDNSCVPPQPFFGSWCQNGNWLAPDTVTITNLPEIFATPTPVVYEKDLTFTTESNIVTQYFEPTPETPNLNITVVGCVSFSGNLVVEVPTNFTTDSLDVFSYSCHDGEFDSVTVLDADGCESKITPDYLQSQLVISFDIFKKDCTASDSTRSFPSVSLFLVLLLLLTLHSVYSM